MAGIYFHAWKRVLSIRIPRDWRDYCNCILTILCPGTYGIFFSFTASWKVKNLIIPMSLGTRKSLFRNFPMKSKEIFTLVLITTAFVYKKRISIWYAIYSTLNNEYHEWPSKYSRFDQYAWCCLKQLMAKSLTHLMAHSFSMVTALKYKNLCWNYGHTTLVTFAYALSQTPTLFNMFYYMPLEMDSCLIWKMEMWYIWWGMR